MPDVLGKQAMAPVSAPQAPQQSPLGDLVSSLYSKYNGLARYRNTFDVRMGQDPGDGRQAEYYPPWESESPSPGKATVELYRQPPEPDMMQNLIAGDMLHYIGSENPQTQKPVDQTFYYLKHKFLQSLTPPQVDNSKRYYEESRSMYGGNPPSYEDWMNSSRGDELLMGYLTPDKADEFRKFYTPDQRSQLELMRSYLQRGSIAPGMLR